MYWNNLKYIKKCYEILYVIIQLYNEQWTSLSANSRQFDIYLQTSCAPMTGLSFILEASRLIGWNIFKFIDFHSCTGLYVRLSLFMFQIKKQIKTVNIILNYG